MFPLTSAEGERWGFSFGSANGYPVSPALCVEGAVISLAQAFPHRVENQLSSDLWVCLWVPRLLRWTVYMFLGRYRVLLVPWLRAVL